MADDPGKEASPRDSNPQDKTGPVRPPVLEGTARATPGAKPARAPASGKTASAAGPGPEATGPAAQKPSRPRRTGAGAPWLAGLAGGLVGLGAAYGLAWFGLWPIPAQAPPPADPRLVQFADAIAGLQGEAEDAEDALATLGERLTGLETDLATRPVPTADAGLAARIDALAAELDALSAAPPALPDGAAGGDAEALAAVTAQLIELRREQGSNARRLDEAESRIGALAQAADQAAADRDTRLPLIFSGLESAFANGRAYEAELTALREMRPDIPVPQVLAAGAAAGLPRPDEVARRLDAAIPDILAGRPPGAETNWQDGVLDWMRGVIAIRPVGDVEGEDPEALVAQLEASLARRDFAAAQRALAAMPASMLQAAGPAAADIALLAEAETFLAVLRRAALDLENGA